MKGTIIGFRPYRFTPSDRQKPVCGYSVCVRRDPAFFPDEYAGDCVDTFSCPESVSGTYVPSVGDAVVYHLYRDNGRQRCGCLLLDPEG